MSVLLKAQQSMQQDGGSMRGQQHEGGKPKTPAQLFKEFTDLPLAAKREYIWHHKKPLGHEYLEAFFKEMGEALQEPD